MRKTIALAALLFAISACGGAGRPAADGPLLVTDGGAREAAQETSAEGGADAVRDLGAEVGADATQADLGRRSSFTVVTFNTGTTLGLPHDRPPDDGYDSAMAKLSDLHYGNGLAWTKAVNATKSFFAKLSPEIVVFQEIFYAGDCPTIPRSAYQGFYCATYKAGAPTVASFVLGAGYQVACHPKKPDKCAAVKKSFGRFRGCNKDFCLEGLAGFHVKDCGGGARVARGVIDLVAGGSITIVNVHGSSGFKSSDQKCRVKQFEQAFVDLGDGKPGASGARNIVLGDLNTDPGRAALLDKSAKRFNDFVGPNQKFHFISEVGPLAKPSYSSLFNIDHVTSDTFKGWCWSAGITPGHPEVINAVYFDHKPLVCKLSLP